jgi:hypothetical protein
MMRRRTLSFLLVTLIAAAACGGGDDAGRPRAPRTAAQADSAGRYAPVDPVVTPAESARAQRAVQRHADSVRDAVLRASGGERERTRRAAPTREASVEERYRDCMEQAEVAEEPVRARLAAACANIRNQPQR